MELLKTKTTEHTEKHDLESFFYVLLYICTTRAGPRKIWSSAKLSDQDHPFGISVKQTTLWNALAGLRAGWFTDPVYTSTHVFKHFHPYFKPIYPMLEKFCNTIFHVLRIGNDEARSLVPKATHEEVLAVLREAFDKLPDDDPGPPDGNNAQAQGSLVHTPQTSDIVHTSREAASTVMLPSDSLENGRLDSLHDSGYGEASTSATLQTTVWRRSSRLLKRSSDQHPMPGPDPPSPKRHRDANGRYTSSG